MPYNRARTCGSALQEPDKLEFVATEHFWMSGMYWGLTAMYLMGRLEEMDKDAILAWVLRCQHPCGGFGASERNDAHMLYTLSAVQILALYDKLDQLDTDKVASCKPPCFAVFRRHCTLVKMIVKFNKVLADRYSHKQTSPAYD